MSTIKAIETRYAGCRFRSRLEARWAVFFDTLGVQWQYEPEGFEIGSMGPMTLQQIEQERQESIEGGWPFPYEDGGWTSDGTSTFYLPDFYLPEYETWVEIKGGDRIGSLEVLNLAINAIDPWSGSILPNADYGMSRNIDTGKNAGLLLLGDIPAPHQSQVVAHAMFEWCKGVRRSPHRFTRPAAGRQLLVECRHGTRYFAEYYDGTCGHIDAEQFATGLHGSPVESYQLIDGLSCRMDRAVLDAYIAARSARFEYGESG